MMMRFLQLLGVALLGGLLALPASADVVAEPQSQAGTKKGGKKKGGAKKGGAKGGAKKGGTKKR